MDLHHACRKLGMDMDAVDCLYRFWILKRRSVANRPLFIPRFDDPEAANNTASLSPSEDNQREKLKKLVALRQDLERVSTQTHHSKSQILVQKFNFDKTPTFSRVFPPKCF